MDFADKELMGASTAILVLAVLERRPNYGYEIVRLINAEAGDALTWREGTVYPVLHRLEKDGLVHFRWREAPTGRRRKYYGLTPSGRKALESGAEKWGLFDQLIVRITGVRHGRHT